MMTMYYFVSDEVSAKVESNELESAVRTMGGYGFRRVSKKEFLEWRAAHLNLPPGSSRISKEEIGEGSFGS